MCDASSMTTDRPTLSVTIDAFVWDRILGIPNVVIAKFVSFSGELGTNERDLNDTGNINRLV